jgi:hypothetical protein
MNDADSMTIGVIRPEQLAHKIATIHNYQCPEWGHVIATQPRWREALWFLQYVSMQPGGLVKFCEEMTRQLPDCFGTDAMRAAKPGEWSLSVKEAAWKEIPSRYLPAGAAGAEDGEEWIACDYLSDQNQEEKAARAVAAKFLKQWGAEDFRGICRDAARKNLPRFLLALCTEPGKSFEPKKIAGCASRTWYMGDLAAAVLEMMDRQSSAVSQRLAMTAVTIKVWDALDYAIQERTMVRIEGDSRFGKTESVCAWCEMRPGLARLVSVPSSNSLADLHRKIAEALGIDVSYGSRKQGVREKIEFILRHSGIFLVLDEAAFLVPQSYTAATAPARLNWVRTEIVDRGLPLAMVVTPQSFMPLVVRFVKKTGYAMEQFFGRNYRTVQLPNELSRGDMVAVAKIHFPEMARDYLELITDLAEVSENYLQAVEAIAKLARYIARREKRQRVTVADIEAAAYEVTGHRPGAKIANRAAESAGKPVKVEGANSRRVKAPLKGGSERLQPGSLQPAETDFSLRSLRGVGLVTVETELASVDT